MKINKIKPVPPVIGAISFMLALGLYSPVTQAKTEYRDVTWKWCLYDCSYSGDDDSPQAVIDGLNAYVDQMYGQCMGSSMAAECGGGCSKINHYGPTPSGGYAVVNGQSIFQQTAVNTSTTYSPGCGAKPAETLVRDLGSASVAAYGLPLCSQEGGWAAAVDSQTTILVDNMGTTSYNLSCQKEIPDPPSCAAPKYGNPIDPVNKAKIEAETDYMSADGLLGIHRFYTSAGGGRWLWGDTGAGLMDFTGRNVSMPPNVQQFVGTIQAVAPGFYYNGGRPAPADTARSFTLLKTQPDTGQKEASVMLPDGSRQVFSEGPLGTFTTTALSKPLLSVSTLPNGNPQWLLKSAKDGFFVFDHTGSLVQRTLMDGKTIAYVSQANSLTATTGPGGRSIIYAKDPVTGKFTTATLPTGQQIVYDIDDHALIHSVTYEDGQKKTYLYNEPAYRGTPISAPAWLTGIVDENQVRVSTFTYDGDNPVSTERSGGVGKYSFNYVSDNNSSPPTGSSIVTMPGIAVTTRLWWERGTDGERRLVSQSQPAGSGCEASSNSLGYDANGNVASRVDFAGKRICMAYDLSRNLETARVEGLTAADTCPADIGAYTVPAPLAADKPQRKVTTQWHPLWRLEARRAEPNKITTTVYNGQPDPLAANAVANCAPTAPALPDGSPIAVVCKRYEQATTDATGSLGFVAVLQAGVPVRTETYTYNQYGQVLTAKGPRTDVNDTTTYVYYASTTSDHTLGDLASVTNPAGQTTTYDLYNPNGQALQSTDANGVVTVNTYDLRQRLTTTKVAGELTQYGYDPVGQLIKLTLPSGAAIGYTYDAAHRLTDITDAAGNKVHYTLDAMGNRINETVSDPNGALAHNITRSFDALNRLQSQQQAAVR